MRLGTGIEIFQYVNKYDFLKWVEFTFSITPQYAHDKLLEFDYIEGALGCRWTKGETDCGCLEVDTWFDKFLEEFNLDYIQLNYIN